MKGMKVKSIATLTETTADGDLAPEVKRLRMMISNFCKLTDGTLLPNIDLRRYGMDSGQLITNTTVQELCAVHGSIESLDITGCSQVGDVGLWAIARHCVLIQRLICFGCNQITTVGIRSLSLRCNALRDLDLTGCLLLDDMSLTVLAGGTWKIERLSLSGCAKVSDNGIVRVAQGLGHSLKYLNLNGCPCIGEFGDRGLREIGAQCHELIELHVDSAKRVEDAGLIALANGCSALNTLLLSGCDTISKKSLKVCCQSFAQLQSLTIINNRRLQDQDFQVLFNSPLRLSLRTLQLRNFQSLTDNGVAFICKAVGEVILHLNFNECKHLTDYSAIIIANFCAQLRSLNFNNCGHFSDESVHSLARKLRNLTELHMDGNRRITTSGLLKHIGRELEFVEMGTNWLGYQPKPKVEALIARRNELLVHNNQAIKIQCLVRRRFADRIYWVRYRERLIARTIPLFQAIVRGYQQRKRYRYLKYQVFKVRQVIKIQTIFRMHIAYRDRIRRVQQENYRKKCIAVAKMIQRVWRGYKARGHVCVIRADRANVNIEEAKVQALRELRAKTIQRVFRGFIARSLAIRKFELLEKQRKYQRRVERMVRLINRIVRGKLGRLRAQRRRAEIALFHLRWRMALEIQRVFRGHRGRIRFKYFLAIKIQNIRNRAALRIQCNYRGYRGRLLAAVARALRILRTKQQVTAVELQRFLRGCMGRHHFKVHKELVTRRKRQIAACLQIQRVFRGHKGREAREIEFELQRLDNAARPLIDLLHRREDEANALRDVVKKLSDYELRLREELVEIERELNHCMYTTNKYTDSIRINQTPQRFLTKFLKVRLKDHLDHETEVHRVKHIELKAKRADLRDLELDIVNTKRELIPLTTGLIGDVKRARTKRLRELVWLRRASATKIQALWRRALVRFSLYDPYKEGWVRRINKNESDECYYFNTISKETCSRKPLAYFYFGERTVSALDAL